jgi:hypothetical protein
MLQLNGLQSYFAPCCSDYSNVAEHSCDLIETMSECKTLIRHFETKRNDISIYNTLYDEAVDIVLSCISHGEPIENEIVPIHR